jgi:pimeloyl-ACP methyl ester carboxylesterase
MTPVENARLLAERIPGAQRQVYPRGRHGFFDEFAAQVKPVVLDCFKSHVRC